MIERILWILMVLFPVSEVALGFLKRSSEGVARSEDRGSLRLLWLGIVMGIGLAIGVRWVHVARFPEPLFVSQYLALMLMLGGLVLRWTAIRTLGRLFTVDVAIQSDHAVVQTGLYRYVRHPSYTGLFTIFLGVGLYFANWLSILCLLVPIVLVLFNRVAKEENALLASLGPEYAAYCARTKRFIPGLL
jgi:protein-S-isoprenylcysteine O-methyltransferase Ste14